MEFLTNLELDCDIAIYKSQIHRLRIEAQNLPATHRYHVYLKIVDIEKELQRTIALRQLRNEFHLIRNPINVYKVAIPKPHIIESM